MCSPNDPHSYITLIVYLIMLSDKVFRPVEFNICLPFFTHWLIYAFNFVWLTDTG